jgi:hypothetical protein
MKKEAVMTQKSKLPKKKSVELADILKAHIGEYQKKSLLYVDQYNVIFDILNCRTAFLGGHVNRCTTCGEESISYNSCRNRHCPKCQHLPREKWIAARKADLLPVKYFHNVFTLPHELNPMILANKKTMLNILFKAVSETLLSFGKNSTREFKGKMGFICVLHTWDQKLKSHFHLHCLVPGGAVSDDSQHWNPCKTDYLFSVKALSKVFRGKYIEYLKAAYHNGELSLKGILSPYKNQDEFKLLVNSLFKNNWVVYIKESIDRPEFVIKYLGRYTHRVAISNQRIVSLKDGLVTFTRKNRNTNTIEEEVLPAVEFIRRFLFHILPKRFVRVRHYGFLSNRNKSKNLKQIRKLIGDTSVVVKQPDLSVQEIMLELTGIDITLCTHCGKGTLKKVREIPAHTGNSAHEIIRPPDLI